MFTRDDGAWVTRQMTARGLNPAQMAGHDRAMTLNYLSPGRLQERPHFLTLPANQSLTAPHAGSVFARR